MAFSGQKYGLTPRINFWTPRSSSSVDDPKRRDGIRRA
jgi:hypothetical protein